MLGLVIAVLALAGLLYAAMRMMRICGVVNHQSMRSCCRMHFRPCYEKWVEFEEEGPWVKLRDIVLSEHVWVNDEYLARLGWL